MAYQLVAFDKLAASVKLSYKALLVHHQISASTVEEELSKLNKISPERRVQCQFLLQVVSILENSDSSNPPRSKEYILNAAVYFVREKIRASYSASYTVSLLTSPVSSSLFNSLGTCLDLRRDNTPDSSGLVQMYSHLEKFLRNNVYNRNEAGAADPAYGYLPMQVFKIDGYKVEEDIILLTDKLHQMRIETIRAAQSLKAKQAEQANSVSSVSSSSVASSSSGVFKREKTSQKDHDIADTVLNQNFP